MKIYHPESSKRGDGFTLIELLVVISIIGVLAGVVVGSLSEARERAKVARALALIKQMEYSLEIYRSDTGDFPHKSCMVTDAVDPVTLLSRECETAAQDPFSTNVDGNPKWSGPYFPPLFYTTHPWGGKLSYEYGENDQDWMAPGEDIDLDFDLDPKRTTDYVIVLDDDLPFTNQRTGGGLVPKSAMIKIDQLLDDGNLATGNVRGGTSTSLNGWPDGGPPWKQSPGVGELMIKIE